MGTADPFIEAFKVEQIGLLANAVVQFDPDTQKYSFAHRSSSYVNEDFRFEHFSHLKRVRQGLIEIELTHEYTLGGGPVVCVTPSPKSPGIVIANTSILGRLIGIWLYNLDGQPCDSDFSIIAIMPVSR